jgi:hypothetical protein
MNFFCSLHVAAYYMAHTVSTSMDDWDSHRLGVSFIVHFPQPNCNKYKLVLLVWSRIVQLNFTRFPIRPPQPFLMCFVALRDCYPRRHRVAQEQSTSIPFLPRRPRDLLVQNLRRLVPFVLENGEEKGRKKRMRFFCSRVPGPLTLYRKKREHRFR